MDTTAEINVKQIFQEIIGKRLSGEELNWFNIQVVSNKGIELKNRFIPLFSAVPRFIPPRILELNPQEMRILEQHYPGFSEGKWDLQQLIRTFLMIQLPVEHNQAILKSVFEMADVKELATLYKGLYFLENAADFILRLQEGIRTNMTDVFEAIALNNPYAQQYLAQEAWNQLVLKAVFIDKPLYRIQGLDHRANEKLAQILHGYIHERWSAGRTVTPEIWRCISGFVNEEIATDLLKVIRQGNLIEKEAATKALKNSVFFDEFQQELELLFYRSWEIIGQEYHQLKSA